jgi:Concanavalin A-like lectin/glucanases superfamily
LKEDRLRRSLRELRSRAGLASVGLLALVALLVPASAALASPYSDAVTVSAPSGWWRLGDATGPGAAAAAGLSAGTWSGTVHLGAPGALDGDADTAATVSGSGWLSLGTTYAPASAFTLEAWVDLASRSSTRYVLSKGTTSLGFHLYVTSGFPSMKVTTSSTTATLSAPTQLPTGSWHHLAATFGGGIAALYVDGVAVTTRAVAGTLRTSGLALTGGRYSGSSSSFFSGGLDELAVYDRALSAAEIAAHAAAALPATPATVAIAGPVARTDSRHAGFTLTPSDPQATFA